MQRIHALDKNAVYCKSVHRFSAETPLETQAVGGGTAVPVGEAVKPPRFVPVFGDRLPGDKNSDFFTHLENLKKLRKHHPRLVTIIEVDFTLGPHFHMIKSN